MELLQCAGGWNERSRRKGPTAFAAPGWALGSLPITAGMRPRLQVSADFALGRPRWFLRRSCTLARHHRTWETLAIVHWGGRYSSPMGQAARLARVGGALSSRPGALVDPSFSPWRRRPLGVQG